MTKDSKDKVRKPLKRLIIEVDEVFHQEIKLKALLRNQTIRKFVLDSVMIRIQHEKKYG